MLVWQLELIFHTIMKSKWVNRIHYLIKEIQGALTLVLPLFVAISPQKSFQVWWTINSEALKILLYIPPWLTEGNMPPAQTTKTVALKKMHSHPVHFPVHKFLMREIEETFEVTKRFNKKS